MTKAGRLKSLLAIAQLDLSLVRRVRAAVCDEAVEDYAANLEVLPQVRVAEAAGRLVCSVSRGMTGKRQRMAGHDGSMSMVEAAARGKPFVVGASFK